jgi:peptidoglycan/LPS O-acetylase OafA/YrhL
VGSQDARGSRSESVTTWVARCTRALGGFVAALLLGTLLLTYSPIDAVAPGADQGPSANVWITLALALAIGLPAAFAIVVALGWRESRPAWPATGFVLGCLALSAVLISTRFLTDEGVPLPHFPDYGWVACAAIPAAGALLGLVFLRRRSATVPEGQPG